MSKEKLAELSYKLALTLLIGSAAYLGIIFLASVFGKSTAADHYGLPGYELLTSVYYFVRRILAFITPILALAGLWSKKRNLAIRALIITLVAFVLF